MRAKLNVYYEAPSRNRVLTDRTASILQSIKTFSSDEWNRCANPASEEYNPFLDHGFLQALEEGGSEEKVEGIPP